MYTSQPTPSIHLESQATEKFSIDVSNTTNKITAHSHFKSRNTTVIVKSIRSGKFNSLSFEYESNSRSTPPEMTLKVGEGHLYDHSGAALSGKLVQTMEPFEWYPKNGKLTGLGIIHLAKVLSST
jgi:hypothetical protein